MENKIEDIFNYIRNGYITDDTYYTNLRSEIYKLNWSQQKALVQRIKRYKPLGTNILLMRIQELLDTCPSEDWHTYLTKVFEDLQLDNTIAKKR